MFILVKENVLMVLVSIKDNNSANINMEIILFISYEKKVTIQTHLNGSKIGFTDLVPILFLVIFLTSFVGFTLYKKSKSELMCLSVMHH